MDFINQVHWVNLRTQANFDLFCALCGETEGIEMHHIKHIRKTPYNKIPEELPWLKAMALRNRKQIPVCKACHMEKIHKGTYQGVSLKTLKPITKERDNGYDLRLINIESYIKPGKEYFGKSLEEKGWVLKQERLIKQNFQ